MKEKLAAISQSLRQIGTCLSWLFCVLNSGKIFAAALAEDFCQILCFPVFWVLGCKSLGNRLQVRKILRFRKSADLDSNSSAQSHFAKNGVLRIKAVFLAYFRRNLFKKSLVFLFSLCCVGNLYADDNAKKTIDVLSIEKEIKKEYERPPLLKDGDIWQQGVNVSKYFYIFMSNNITVMDMKDILEENGYITDWRDANDNIVSFQQAQHLSALKMIYKVPFFAIRRDRGIVVGAFFDNTGKVLEIRAIYFKYPY